MDVYVSIIQYDTGTQDVEVLDCQPTESFRDELKRVVNQRIAGAVAAEIRVASVNGGDSATVFRTPAFRTTA